MTPARADVPTARARRLSRRRVAVAAVAAIDRDGVDALSMRALAANLGVTPMALYNHVGGRLDLLRAVAELLLEEIQFDNGAEAWRDRISGCFRALRAACLRHPGAARLFQVDGVAPAAIFAPMRVTVDALTSAGLPAAQALRAYFTLIAFTLGQTGYQAQDAIESLEVGAAVDQGRLDERLAETIRPVVAEAWDFREAFEFGLTLVLDGLEAALTRTGSAR